MLAGKSMALTLGPMVTRDTALPAPVLSLHLARVSCFYSNSLPGMSTWSPENTARPEVPGGPRPQEGLPRGCQQLPRGRLTE